MEPEPLKIAFPVQGWRQFLASRAEMLGAFDAARQKAKGHEVETYHGKVAEAQFRRWLSEFLPKRYGVTSGFVISIGIKSPRGAPHYDIIIYDALNSPVLWVEEDPDTSPGGRSLAIPAEHILAVLEVKSALTAETVQLAVEHLGDLAPLMRGVDEPSLIAKLHLPASFVCGAVFFELRREDSYSEQIMQNLLAGAALRGFIGGFVLKGEGRAAPDSGRLQLLRGNEPMESSIGRSKQSLLESAANCATTAVAEGVHLNAMIWWMEPGFSQFAFDLLAMLQGRYASGRILSWHGMGTSDHEKPA